MGTKKSLFNDYEVAIGDAKTISTNVRAYIRTLLEEYGDTYSIRELEVLCTEEIHVCCSERRAINAMNKRKVNTN